MEKLTKKTLDVSRGFTYAYYTSPAKDGLQTFLLIHGFPDSPEEYSDVVRDYLVPNGYGVIAVDCLGYSGSSKPLDTEAYSLDLVSRDFSEILDQESVDRVICTGHDWVSYPAPFFTSSLYRRMPMGPKHVLTSCHRVASSRNASTTSTRSGSSASCC